MASKVQTVENLGSTIVVTIKHNKFDSFSRSVDPTASRVWNKLPHHVRMATQYRTGRYGATDTADGGCISVIVWSSSWDEGEALLDERFGPRGF